MLTQEQVIDSVLRERYLAPGESTKEDVYKRAAYSVNASNADAIFSLMKTNVFLPNTPTLANAGTDHGTLSACFVLPIQDSLEGIYQAIHEMGIVHKSFGGTGFFFGKLRPEGSPISTTGGKACGPIEVLRILNQNAEMVRQGGKRHGANMGILNIDHPDFPKWITCKDSGGLSHFNLSVSVTDDFMRKRDERLDAICEHAWRTGDPGLIFIDAVNRDQPKGWEPINATNPCVTGRMLVPTSSGLKRVDSLEIGDSIYVGKNKFENIVKIFDVGVREVFKLVTSRGYAIEGTSDHKVMAARGLVSIDKLSLEDEIEVQQEGYLPSGGDIDEGYLAGVIFGDGWESCDRIGISFNDIETSESSRICNYINSKFGTSLTIRRYKQRSGNYVLRLMTGQNKFYEFGSNSKNLYWCISHPKEWVRGFISGWFFADGHIESGNSNSIAITNSNREYLEVLATSLLQFGISTSNIYFVKRAGHESDEIYDINGNNGSYRLTLTGEDKIKFATEFPLRGTIKDCLNIVRPTLSRKPKEFQKVISIKFIGEEKVYDFTTDGEKLFFANGIKTLDCGEQPLGDYESCNLGSINLGTFATDPECEVCDQGFDIGSFLWTIDHCVRYLDAIIDIDHYPLEQIKLETQARRKIGLGVMGWADTLIQLNIPWCSQQALDLIDHIGEALHNQTRATSEQLAQEFSPFPMYDGRLCNYPPRRNATLTTIAPTGTLSKLAKCSSGIEPIYDWEYDIFTEQGTYHYSYPLRSDPCVNDIAHMIPYDWHIKHQAQWQKWIDNAVSKTINLPAEATVEDVRNAFILAWELGCKGITIYRDGSKDEQVLTSRSIKPGFIRRPGAIYEVKSGCGTLRVVLGATDDSYTELYEGYAITAGGCTANNEAIGRSISLEMQEHIPVEKITGTLHKVRCINAMRNPQSAGRSCADIIATCIDIETKEFVHKEPTRKTLDSCPSCKAPLQHIEGCGTGTCLVCGWSGCS